MRRAVMKKAANMGFLPVESPLRLQKPVVMALNTLIVVTTAARNMSIRIPVTVHQTDKPEF
jgi:hypothetical protein